MTGQEHTHRLSETHPYLGALLVIALVVGTVALFGIGAVLSTRGEQ